MSKEFDRLDAAIVENIRRHQPAMLWVASGGDARKEAHRIAEAKGQEDFRVIDGRLQALRRAGVIAYKRGRGPGWILVGGK